MVEDAIDKRDSDPALAMRLLTRALDALTSYWFKKQGVNQPRQKEVLSAIAAADSELGDLLQRFWGDNPWDSRFEAGLLTGFWKREAFFEWESEQQPVVEPPDPGAS